MILVVAGTGISVHAVRKLGEGDGMPAAVLVWAPLLSMVVKGVLAAVKFRTGRRIASAALVADAWNDSVDILSAFSALLAVSLTLYNPDRFALADAGGALVVGVIVVVTGLRVVRDASLELTDTMPPSGMLAEIRRIAAEVAEVQGVEKCFARKTGFRYHVDLHIEVDPRMTVAESHVVAHRVQDHILERVPYVAGVLVHIEPRISER